MEENRHIHLIGICGTAMASLAGMLKQRGFRVTGSDAGSVSADVGFFGRNWNAIAQPFDAQNLEPKPDLVVVGNAISRAIQSWSMSWTSASHSVRCPASA